MRIAICFYGLVGSKTNKNGKDENLDPKIAYNLYNKHLFNKNNNVDIFIHSWSADFKEQLVNLYKPISYIIEPQIQFPQSKGHPSLHGNFRNKMKMAIYKLFDKDKYISIEDERTKSAFRAYSRWYSTKKTISLKQEYESRQKFKYDCVMLTRLDVGFFTDIIFKNFNMNFFYASHWNDYPNYANSYIANRVNHYAGKGFLDFWFFSSSENMDQFSALYDNITKYSISPHRSSRQHVDTFLNDQDIRYIFYRWFDHEMLRRKYYNSTY
jgi:hypothetical protein